MLSWQTPDAKKLASFFAVFVETLSGRSILKGNSNVPRSATFRQDCRPKQHRRDDRADPRATTAPQLSAAQKTAIFTAVSKDKSKSSTQANFQASIGEKVPSSVELHTLPPDALANAQLASSYRYTMANHQVVLVDPLTMQVVDIIRQ